MSRLPPRRFPVPALLATVCLAASIGTAAFAQQNKREFAVNARKYAFSVAGSGSEIRVQQDDIVEITFTADDIAHGFTIVNDDHYRISKRAEAGKSITFSFRADLPGSFSVKCTLPADSKCKEMAATLIVVGRSTAR